MNEHEISGAAIFNLIMICTLFFFAGFVFGSSYKRKKIYRYASTGWLKVSEHPIPEDIDRFIATDGKDVSTERSVTYNSKGKPIMGYDQKEIKEWQPLPEAPNQKTSFFLQEHAIKKISKQ